MGMILSFAPLIVFPIVAGFYSVSLGLWAATVAACLVAGSEAMRTHRPPKLLNWGQAALFGGLALFGTLLHVHWNVQWAKLTINAGLLAIVLVSIAIGRPFTLQYARENVPKEYWNAPLFVATNLRITLAWAAAFAVMVAANLVRLFAPAIPVFVDSALGFAALIVAALFTSWYPKHVRASVQHSRPA